MNKWCLTDHEMCACDKIQMMLYIVNSCPNAMLDNRLLCLYSADDHAIIWLMSLGIPKRTFSDINVNGPLAARWHIVEWTRYLIWILCSWWWGLCMGHAATGVLSQVCWRWLWHSWNKSCSFYRKSISCCWVPLHCFCFICFTADVPSLSTTTTTILWPFVLA